MARKWRALDHCNNNNHNVVDADFTQENTQVTKVTQESFEWIIVRDSEGVTVHTTDTQVAVSLQLAIQAAIAAVISISLGDNNQANAITQDLKQFMRTKQRNTQKTIIEGSKCITVKTVDTDVAVNIQAMLQVLLAIVAKLDVA